MVLNHKLAKIIFISKYYGNLNWGKPEVYSKDLKNLFKSFDKNKKFIQLNLEIEKFLLKILFWKQKFYNY